MPIGAQRYAQVAGRPGTPATLRPGEGPFPATGSDATAAPLELRNERMILTAGVATLAPPAAGQYFLVERITMIVVPATADGVGFTLGPYTPGNPFGMTVVDQVPLVSGVFVYVNDTNHPIYVPENQELTVSAITSSAIDTSASGVLSVQYRVITP